MVEDLLGSTPLEIAKDTNCSNFYKPSLVLIQHDTGDLTIQTSLFQRSYITSVSDRKRQVIPFESRGLLKEALKIHSKYVGKDLQKGLLEFRLIKTFKNGWRVGLRKAGEKYELLTSDNNKYCSLAHSDFNLSSFKDAFNTYLGVVEQVRVLPRQREISEEYGLEDF